MDGVDGCEHGLRLAWAADDGQSRIEEHAVSEKNQKQ